MKNNDIKVLSRGCKIMYAVYLFAVIFFAGVYELLPEAKGKLVGNDVAEYALDTVCVLLTMITVPLSLKLFAHFLTKHKSLDLKDRMERYHMLWNVRIVCFGIVTIFDLWAYYATLNNIGGFCALICVAASLLFAPTKKRIAGDLDAKD